MKIFAVTAILVALYFMYRLAFPKKGETKKGGGFSPEREKDTDDVVGKSRFVSAYRSQPMPTPATSVKPDNQEEKPYKFALESKKYDAVIPTGELDEIFSKPPEPMDIYYPLEPVQEEEPDIDAEEEAEELRQSFGEEYLPAGGFTYEEMEQAAEAVNHPSKGTEEEAGRILWNMEKTDMFEQLVSGDEAKLMRIRSLIDKHVESITPQETDTEEDDGYGGFDISGFLS